MFKKFHKSEISQNNGIYAKSVCLGKVTVPNLVLGCNVNN